MTVSGLFFCKIGCISAGIRSDFLRCWPASGFLLLCGLGLVVLVCGLLACGAVCSRLCGLMCGSCPALTSCGAGCAEKKNPAIMAGLLVMVLNYLILFSASFCSCPDSADLA